MPREAQARGRGLNRRHKKTLNLAIQGFRYLVPETESNSLLQITFYTGLSLVAM